VTQGVIRYREWIIQQQGNRHNAKKIDIKSKSFESQIINLIFILCFEDEGHFGFCQCFWSF